MQSSETTDELEMQSKFQAGENSPMHSNQNTVSNNQFTFKDMRLKIGDQLQIKLSPQTTGIRYSVDNEYCVTNLIGYYQDRSLLVSIPHSAHTAECSMMENDKLAIYFFSGQTLFKFISYIDKIISLPYRYMHLSFPSQISGQTIRKSRRINVCLEATANNSDTPTIITDISTAGAKIETSSDIGQPGDLIDLTFTINLYEKETQLTVKAIIRSFNITHANEHPLCFGVEFTELHHEQIQMLRDLVYQQIIDGFK
ncbi:MAG: hypothetical protein NMNS02_29870 [Nitrosomonas sp.]|nr:MAG: hypothetical protein NMNS02_29870 [Nitrosomonas sp.]